VSGTTATDAGGDIVGKGDAVRADPAVDRHIEARWRRPERDCPMYARAHS
jgi:hypothetical protein